MATGDTELVDSGEIVPPGDQLPATMLVSDRWLLLVRFGWCAIAIYTLALFIVGVPVLFEQLQTACTGMLCASQQLSPVAVQLLISLGISLRGYAISRTILLVVAALVWFGVAGVLFWRKSNDWVALLVSLMLVMQGAVNVVRILENASTFLLFSAHIVDFLAFFLLLLVFSVFPDGRVVPRRWAHWLLLGWAIVNAGNAFVTLSNPVFFVLIWYSFIGSFVAAQIYRYRRLSSRVQRQQTKWIVFMVVMTFCCEAGTFFGNAFEFFSHRQDIPLQLALSLVADVAPILIPFGFGVAILRYRLWDIDHLINRTLVYGTLTVSIIGVYACVVSVFEVVLQAHGNFVVALLASGFVVVLFHPLRDRLQRTVNRLMYGERDEPYQAISRLGQRLEATLAPGAVLPAIVETIAHSLKLPYAVIEVREGDQFRLAARWGAPAQVRLRLLLMYQSEVVGQLLLAPHAQEDSFTSADRKLLADFARQAGIAVYAVRLTDDLQHARERLVTAREEERRRMRRDLHDGLGPVLASLTLKLDAVRNLLKRDPTAAEAMLLTLKSQTQTAVEDIRRLAYELRPPTLDELGLVSALREQAIACTNNRLHVSVDAPTTLPPLTAATEVAVYRIVQEALANVVRHAHAHSCTVHLRLDEDVCLEIRDDGQGLPEGYRIGVGLVSMRERATELGGTFLIEPMTPNGTCILVRLPLPKGR